ncbi:MAG: R3H domain-containing nucleic acid-binding protein [Patescibacteria group bacterium]
MEQFKQKVTRLVELIGFSEPSLSFDSENKKVEIFVNEGEWLKRWLPNTVSDLDHVVKLVARREGLEDFFLDLNNYRKERERLIVELAKAAARKASVEKQLVRLPAMNAYERRLVHVELAVHPDVTTESEGDGRERCVVIKPIE